MDLEIVFNELSLRVPAANVQTARQWMSEFINTLLVIKPSSGVKRKLRAKSDFSYLLLAPDYRLVQWRNEPNVDLEARRFLKTLQDKNDPPLPDIADPGIEVKYQGGQAVGLEYAFVFNAIAVSLRSELIWDCSRIELEVTPLDEDDNLTNETEEIVLNTTFETIVHASCSDHVREHVDWITNRTKTEVYDGRDLWQRREALFPNLVFCDDVSKQLESLAAGNPMLRQVVKRLIELEKACKNWTDKSVNLDSLPCKVSPESESRLKQLKQKLTFKCPDGEERIFSLHVRMTPGAWRLYFSGELGPGKITIGYIGSKIQ